MILTIHYNNCVKEEEMNGRQRTMYGWIIDRVLISLELTIFDIASIKINGEVSFECDDDVEGNRVEVMVEKSSEKEHGALQREYIQFKTFYNDDDLYNRFVEFLNFIGGTYDPPINYEGDQLEGIYNLMMASVLSEDIAEFNEGVVSRIVSEEEWNSFQHVKYRERSDMFQDTLCSICKCDYEVDDEVTVVKCKHSFHKECVRGWFKLNNTCPTCRVEVCTGVLVDPSRGEQDTFIEGNIPIEFARPEDLIIVPPQIDEVD